MSQDTRGRCRTCGAAVLWLTSLSTGKLSPINAEPAPGGNVSIDEAQGVWWIDGDSIGPRHTSHFATCKQAAGWRGRGTR